jgi:ferritin
MTPNKLSDKIVKFINDRLIDEYTAHYLYNAAANWCADKNYVKAAKFFAEEASAEIDHANGLQAYLTRWNVLPDVPKVETNHEFSGLVDIIEQAYTIEYDLYKKYNEISKQILVIDPSTFDFLEKYREIQNDSVAEFSDLLNALALINTDNLFELLYFEQTYFP